MISPLKSFTDVLPGTLDALARGGIAASQARLTPVVREFHRELLRIFLRTGMPPRFEHLAQSATTLQIDLMQTLATLAEADLVHTDPTTHAVQVAYPLAGRPSPHQVRLGDGPALTAMCAVDALGIPLMTRSPATIVSADPTTGEEIHIRGGLDSWDWQPTSTVVLLATSESCGPIAVACTSTAFHASRERAEAYLAGHPGYTGSVLTQAQALSMAANEFGDLLEGSN